ncbi:MAG: amidohydrolase family protein [Formosimonas sp.]
MYKKYLTALSLACAAAWSAHAQEAIPAAPKGVLFENVRIFDGSGAPLSAPSYVLVEGNTIKQISKQPIQGLGSDYVTIQGKGRTLMPGLIDNHVHIFMSANTQASMMDANNNFATLEANGAQEASNMLLRGFTAVRDVGGPVFGIKRAIDQNKAVGPRIYPSGAVISQTSGHGDSREPHERAHRFFGGVSAGVKLGANFIADGRDEVLTATRENLRSGASQIKVMAGGGAATIYDPLDVTQYTLDEMKAAVEAAEDWGTYVTVHAYTTKAVRRAIDAGVKSIEHGQLLDEATIKLLAQKGIWLSLQSLDEAPESAPLDVRTKKHTVVEGTDNAFKWALKHKVKLAWGTDFLFNPAQNKNQSSDILKLKKWMTPRQILKMLTKDNAELLALSGPRNPYKGKLGVVETNALADLLLINGDPTQNLELLAQPEPNIALIMKNGRIYKHSN